jgi:tetratricopeptide (TPR) repeat protein
MSTDFFISFTNVDRAWAEWIAWQLEQAQYSTILQTWDFDPGSNWVYQMHRASMDSRRTIAVLSPDYMRAGYGGAEWMVAFAEDPVGENRKLIPVRVADFKPTGLLGPITYIDLVGRSAEDARSALLRGVQEHRPVREPDFPGEPGLEFAGGQRPDFPGSDLDPGATRSVGPGSLVGQLPASRRVFGRVAEIRQLTNNLLAKRPRPTPVLGPPGIGKSAICAAALHRQRVANRFADRRYFVRCEGARSAAAVLTMIASSLGLKFGSDDPLPQVVATLGRAPTVLVLDNADTPWEADADRTVDLLERLAAVPGLALAASIRGQQRPPRIPWNESILVQRLEHDDALRLFLNVAGRRYGTDPHLDTLVSAQDGLPLTVTLLARLAEGEPYLRGLWEQWTERRGALLRERAGGGDQLSEEASFEVSINSPRTTQEARRLLALLGVLPDGVAHLDLDTLLPGTGEPAASSLRRVGLASDEDQRLRTLAPIRDYLHDRYRPSESDLEHAVAHYRNLGARLGAKAGAVGGAEASERLSAEMGNVGAMLDLGFQGDDPRPSIRAAISVASFMRFSGLGTTHLLESARAAASRIGEADLEARVLKGMGHVALVRSDFEEAVARYTAALQRFEQTGNEKHQALSIKSLGHVALRQGRYNLARGRYETALDLFEKVAFPLGQADSIAGLGDVAFEQGDYDSALRHYETAQALYQDLGHERGIANCMLDRGEIALSLEDHDDARRCFEEAQPLYIEIGHIHGVAKCDQGLALVGLAQRDLGKARTFFRLAEQLYVQLGAREEQAWSLAGLGDVAAELDRHEDARACYEQAKDLFSQIRDERGMEATANRLQRLP